MNVHDLRPFCCFRRCMCFGKLPGRTTGGDETFSQSSTVAPPRSMPKKALVLRSKLAPLVPDVQPNSELISSHVPSHSISHSQGDFPQDSPLERESSPASDQSEGCISCRSRVEQMPVVAADVQQHSSAQHEGAHRQIWHRISKILQNFKHYGWHEFQSICNFNYLN